MSEEAVVQGPLSEQVQRLAGLSAAKKRLRQQAYSTRIAQPDKASISKLICDRFIQQAEYSRAVTIMCYLHCRSEVRTRDQVQRMLKCDVRTVVPYCTVDERGEPKLGLWHLESIDELVPGRWKILEPPEERWGEAGKEVEPGALDLVMVPGVGFDRNGGRLGNGLGFYDRLLAQVRSDASLIAICYESQLFDEIMVGPEDISMDKVITERGVYYGRGR